jgi:shikimate 5-dehydrogenase
MSRTAAFAGKQNRFYEIGDGSAGFSDVSAVVYPDAIGSLELGSFDVLVNATPLGTREGEDPALGAPLPQKMTVVDLALPSKEAALVRRATESGCVVVPGGEVAAEQARLDIEVWTRKPFK